MDFVIYVMKVFIHQMIKKIVLNKNVMMKIVKIVKLEIIDKFVIDVMMDFQLIYQLIFVKSQFKIIVSIRIIKNVFYVIKDII